MFITEARGEEDRSGVWISVPAAPTQLGGPRYISFLLLSAKDKCCPACFPAGKKEVLGSAELGTEMRGQEGQKRSKLCSLPTVSGSRLHPILMGPWGDPGSQGHRLRGWGREPAGAERPVVCQTAPFTPYLVGHLVDRMEPLKVKKLWWYLRGPQLIVADPGLLFWFVWSPILTGWGSVSRAPNLWPFPPLTF